MPVPLTARCRALAAARAAGHETGEIVKITWHEAMDRYGDEAARRFYLTAQTDKVSLYEKLGYSSFGHRLNDAGNIKMAMKKK